MTVPQLPGILLVGRSYMEEAALEDLAADLRADHPAHRVAVALLEGSASTVFDEVRKLGRRCGAVTVVPAFLSPGGPLPSGFISSLAVASACHPGVHIQTTTPLGTEAELRQAVRRRLAPWRDGGADSLSRTGIVVLGQGGRDPEALGPLVSLAWHLGEDLGTARADGAFRQAAPPSLRAVVGDQVTAGIRRILVFPHCLFPDPLLDQAKARVAELRERFPSVDLDLCGPLGNCPEVRHWVTTRLEAVEAAPYHAGDPPWSC